jgi:hypothetical protein
MGRHQRTKLSQFHGVSSRYSSEFGPRKSFDAGFQQGLRAGCSDGFVGRKFRALEDLRSISGALDVTPACADPANFYFDQGVSTGYSQGFSRARRDASVVEQFDIPSADCAGFHPVRQQDAAAQPSFCDGYRRGYVLGRADAVVLSPDAALAARK